MIVLKKRKRTYNQLHNSDGDVYVNSKNNNIITECDVFDISSTKALILPVGNIASRPSAEQTGMIRYNTAKLTMI